MSFIRKKSSLKNDEFGVFSNNIEFCKNQQKSLDFVCH